ncbi:amidohydrolase [Cypionkella aquatica]|uniref:Amidohydrolase n=1 Tax=Cypionkella aquatica TaxID=1756042 RepID=A0AA37U6A4_9RHOB|nr:amidohydrolase [Cypionkella aquatica]GLS86336.1 amidohydrolase [Cypionkella aquatica]
MTTTLIHNANIRTMNPACPQSDAILLQDGKVVALGDKARSRAGDARQIDAGGRLLLPGFQDAHIHLLNGGTDLVETAQLYDCTTLADIQAAMAAHQASQTGPMIWGAGWQSGFFGDHNLTRDILDAVVPDRPCLIYDGNFHNACLNSKALQIIGVGPDTPDPLNGHIVRDSSGVATGMLHEEAINWATNLLPQTSDATRRQGLAAGMAWANKHGITGVIDPWILDHHARIYSEGLDSLTLRVAGACLVTAADSVETMLTRLRAFRAAHCGQDFHLNAAKFFLDGGLENRTAALLAPYADAASGNAALMFSQAQIDAMFTALDAERFQIHVHCIGDAATHAALNGFQAARDANGAWPSLHQIAHCQLVDPVDFPRFAALGVMANLQPLWACNDPIIPDDTMAMIGPKRAPNTYAFRSLIDAGAPYCINSDWAVTTLNPFEIIGTAVTREPPRARGVAEPFFPDQCLTVEEAVLGYTTHAAAACWRGHYTGALKPGYSADLILLDRDIFNVNPYAIAETRVLLTLFKGREIYRAETFSS